MSLDADEVAMPRNTEVETRAWTKNLLILTSEMADIIHPK
jgi:hypothetical protein